ncbi:MAG TPA: MIP family channel protein [Ktedonobacteraceae bacterium]|nr:MIP family channel protein [Ktedonobacteraceae bacterium]
MNYSLLRRAGAELIGTYGLVTAGCGAIIASSQLHALPPIGVALAFGLVIALMIAAVGHISGGHINPAVSISLAVTRHLPWKDLPFYLVAQFLGATLGALTLLGFFGSQAVALTVNMPAAHVSVLQAMSIEAVLTAFLVFVITSVATDTQSIGKMAAFAIGGTILLDALWGGPISGASMNPARSFGPALIAGDWGNLWIYFVGPIIGGIIGSVLYQLIRQPSADSTNTKSSAA